MKGELRKRLESQLTHSVNTILVNPNIRYISHKRITLKFYKLGYSSLGVFDVTISRMASDLLDCLEEKGFVKIYFIRKKRKLYEVLKHEEIKEEDVCW